MDASADAVRNRQLTEGSRGPMPKMEDSDAKAAPAHGSPAPGSDVTFGDKDKERVQQLESNASAMYNSNAKLSGELAMVTKKLAEEHDRYSRLAQDHANMVKSHAKRIEEKNRLMGRLAELLQEIADLKAESAAQIEDLVARDNTINELEAARHSLMNARQQDALTTAQIKTERDYFKYKLDAIKANLTKGDHDQERHEREKDDKRGRDRDREADQTRGHKRARSNHRDDKETERERGEQRARSMARKSFSHHHKALVVDCRREPDKDKFKVSTHHHPSEHGRRDSDAAMRAGYDAYRPHSAPLPREDHVRAPAPRKDSASREWKEFRSANGKLPPTGPKSTLEPKPKPKPRHKPRHKRKQKPKHKPKFKSVKEEAKTEIMVKVESPEHMN